MPIDPGSGMSIRNGCGHIIDASNYVDYERDYGMFDDKVDEDTIDEDGGEDAED